MKRLLRATLILSVNIIYFSSFAQREEHQFGKITQGEVDMTVYDKDTEAGAVVLFDHGKSSFIRDQSGSSAYVINFKRIRRIKIFVTIQVSKASFKRYEDVLVQ